MQVLNFYSTIFADQLKRGRKTATIRLGDKSHKYRKNQAVLVTIGYQYSPREKIFDAVIDQVEVTRLRDLSPRDIEHDNPEFRRHEDLVHFLEQIYGREVSLDDVVTVHHGHMPEIEVTSPTTATGTWAMEDKLRWPEGSPIKIMHGYGHYHETYTKVDGHWRIATTRLSRLRIDIEMNPTANGNA